MSDNSVVLIGGPMDGMRYVLDPRIAEGRTAYIREFPRVPWMPTLTMEATSIYEVKNHKYTKRTFAQHDGLDELRQPINIDHVDMWVHDGVRDVDAIRMLLRAYSP